MTQDFNERLDQIFADENNGAVDLRGTEKRTKELLKYVQTTVQSVTERQQQEKQQQVRRKRESARLEEQLAGDPLAAAEDPAEQEDKLNEIKRQVEQELGDVDDLDEEPETYSVVVRSPQALPALKIDHLPMLQQTLSTLQLVTDAADDSSSSSSSSALEAAFTWLLRGSYDQLLVCPDADVAKATFQAVCFGGRELATAAYQRFLGWCGMTEVQRGYLGKDVTEESWVTESDSSKPGLSGVLCRSDQQPQPTAVWLPTADDFVKALHALGCGSAAAGTAAGASKRTSAAAAAATPATPAAARQDQQQTSPHAPITNFKLLLQLLAHVCRLQSAETSRLPYSLGNGVQGAAACKQLAVMLMSLMLDRQLAEANCGCVLSEALGALIGVLPEPEWGRVQKQLLDTFSRGLGPTNRSLLLVLNQLPLTERGASLRQHAALQLVRKLTPQGKKADAAGQAKSFGSAREVQGELVKLLGREPSKALLQGFLVKDKDGKEQQDTWALLDLLEAAHLVLWTDLIRPGVGVSKSIRDWFVKWAEVMERKLQQSMKSHKVKATLTELANAYQFWSSSTAGADDDGVDDGDNIVE